MALVLKIEEQQKGMLAQCVREALAIAARCPTLDRAEESLRFRLTSSMWLIGRGGHHVWMSWQTAYGPVRVAMIEERSEHQLAWGN